MVSSDSHSQDRYHYLQLMSKTLTPECSNSGFVTIFSDAARMHLLALLPTRCNKREPPITMDLLKFCGVLACLVRAELTTNVAGDSKMAMKVEANSSVAPQVILRIAEVARRLGISVSTVWARMNPTSSRYDPDFPKTFKLHANLSGRGAVGILESDLEQYIENCKARKPVKKGAA